MELESSLYVNRLSFGFHNPNHAAAEGRVVGTQRFWNKMFFSSGSDDVFFTCRGDINRRLWYHWEQMDGAFG